VGPDGIRRGDCQSPRRPSATRPAGCLTANLPHRAAEPQPNVEGRTPRPRRKVANFLTGRNALPWMVQQARTDWAASIITACLNRTGNDRWELVYMDAEHATFKRLK